MLASLPRLGAPPLISGYGPVFIDGGPGLAQPENNLSLTLCGLRQLPDAADFVAMLLKLIGFVARQEGLLRPSPTSVVTSSVTRADLAGWLKAEQFVHSTDTAGWMRVVLEHEPPTWGGFIGGEGADWEINLRPQLRSFRDVASVDDYLDRVAAILSPPSPIASPLLASPLTLPSTLNHLDVVWRLWTGEPLLGLISPTAVARLALDCDELDGFDSRLSALAEVFNSFRVERTPNAGTIETIRLRLREALPDERYDRVENAAATLKSAIRIRAGAQHSGVAAEAAKRLADFGIAYPITDVGAAWDVVRIRVAAALDAIREEIQALGQNDSSR